MASSPPISPKLSPKVVTGCVERHELLETPDDCLIDAERTQLVDAVYAVLEA
jgi:hypothetical protein